MRLKPHIILKLFLNSNDFEPQYSFNLYFDKLKSVSSSIIMGKRGDVPARDVVVPEAYCTP